MDCFHQRMQKYDSTEERTLDIITLMMVPETLENFNQLTWLLAQEDFIKMSRHESFASCEGKLLLQFDP
jgi:hypothetical protein